MNNFATEWKDCPDCVGDEKVDPKNYIVGDPDNVIPFHDPESPASDQPPAAEPPKMRSMVIRGVNSYPTTVPPETVVLGNGWLRRGDVATFISTAGGGKSVAVTQASMAWALGLPYFGIKPPRPLRILLFSGEDDGVTIGQCREGFLEHSEAITGRKLTARNLDRLDDVLRTEFIREHVGLKFHAHLEALLAEEPVDLVIVNPLLSYIGGEVVAEISEWMRSGVMPILQRHDCAALFAHHTPKMSTEGWETTDDVYSGIGGGEVANIPRSVLTLRPTAAEGLMVLKVGKRQTTGWVDGNGDFTACYFVRRSGNPERPAWLPVNHDEARDEIGDSKGSTEKRGSPRKVTLDHVLDALKDGATQQFVLIETIQKAAGCSPKTAKDAIKDAGQKIATFQEINPKGGHPLRWYCLLEHKPQWVKP